MTIAAAGLSDSFRKGLARLECVGGPQDEQLVGDRHTGKYYKQIRSARWCTTGASRRAGFRTVEAVNAAGYARAADKGCWDASEE